MVVVEVTAYNAITITHYAQHVRPIHTAPGVYLDMARIQVTAIPAIPHA